MIDVVQRIQYAKSKSDCIAKEDGSFVPREKKKKQEEKGLWAIFHLDSSLVFFSDSLNIFVFL